MLIAVFFLAVLISMPVYAEFNNNSIEAVHEKGAFLIQRDAPRHDYKQAYTYDRDRPVQFRCECDEKIPKAGASIFSSR